MKAFDFHPPATRIGAIDDPYRRRVVHRLKAHTPCWFTASGVLFLLTFPALDLCCLLCLPLLYHSACCWNLVERPFTASSSQSLGKPNSKKQHMTSVACCFSKKTKANTHSLSHTCARSTISWCASFASLLVRWFVCLSACLLASLLVRLFVVCLFVCF